MAFQVVMLFANGALSIGLYFFIPWLSMALLLDPAGCNSGSLCTTYSDQFYRVNALLGNALGFGVGSLDCFGLSDGALGHRFAAVAQGFW